MKTGNPVDQEWKCRQEIPTCSRIMQLVDRKERYRAPILAGDGEKLENEEVGVNANLGVAGAAFNLLAYSIA